MLFPWQWHGVRTTWMDMESLCDPRRNNRYERGWSAWMGQSDGITHCNSAAGDAVTDRYLISGALKQTFDLTIEAPVHHHVRFDDRGPGHSQLGKEQHVVE